VLAATARAVKASPYGQASGPALTALPPPCSSRYFNALFQQPRHASNQPKTTDWRLLTRTGPTDKQGSRLVRWAAVEAVGRQRGATPIRTHHHRVADRRGKNIGRVAAARKLVTLVYYGLRDGQIRCLAAEQG
jgi:hypothetical protein